MTCLAHLEQSASVLLRPAEHVLTGTHSSQHGRTSGTVECDLLLAGEAASPIDIYMGPGVRTLLLTFK